MSQILDEAQELFNRSEFDDCIRLLKHILEKDAENLAAIHLLGECYAEIGDPEQAYGAFSLLANADPDGSKYGYSKFLWLGQLSSGKEAANWYDIGIDLMRKELSSGKQEAEAKIIRTKMAQALCALIEIWMTDLCMEPEAEQICEKCITEALLVDDQQPENWSVLGSIRISQQRDDDARQALDKSLQLFSDPNTYELTALSIPPLIRLAQSMMELGQYAQVLDVTTLLNELDDQVIDAYYLNGLAHYELFQQKSAENQIRTANRHVIGAQEAWTAMDILAKQQHEDDYSEMIASIQDKMKSLPIVNPGDYSESENEDQNGD